MLRQCDSGFVSDLGLGRRGVDDEDQRLARAIAQVDRGADGAQIVRARAGRDDNQLGYGDDALDRHGDRRGRIDDGQAEALLAEHFKVGGKPRDGGLREGGHFVLPFVPPIGKAALGIDVDQADGAGTGHLRLHRQMSGQGRLARSAFLRCHCQNAHSIPLALFHADQAAT